MELIDLKNRIKESFKGSPDDLREVLKIVEEDQSIFPFNEYEHLICSLIDKGGLSYQQYIDIRTEYINENPNLWIFEISAPRGFGEKFAQTYIKGKCSKLKIPSKELDSNYSGDYDFWLDGIKIEVKASRAVDSSSDEPLYMKALSRNTSKDFVMNFQQLKPQCCDVFVWVAVFRDEIVVWVMSSSEVLNNPLYSKGQHRGNKGNEGQLHIKQDNISQLDRFELKDDNLEEAIRRAFHRN
ncbi:hypothetical protein [Riemerella anatipestifer]|uniref:hypothetical protein n=1 Tax=Riemerella anatipestifer TaxID=34085 RepID=UPI0021D5E315|nr:hypothetical protein [Riemerella anatipestifer]MCU7541664.1 hypothetical protein [Riemerella anatipestifer]MCW0512429.1 hypothetical protein [Riemerella anatipestifer]